MNSSYIRRILQLGPLMQDLAVSAPGCFVFMRGFRAVAMEQRSSDTRSSMRVDGRSGKPLAGFGAAAFLLAFVASEAAATVVALHR
jgi:hypothetical protein